MQGSRLVLVSFLVDLVSSFSLHHLRFNGQQQQQQQQKHPLCSGDKSLRCLKSPLEKMNVVKFFWTNFLFDEFSILPNPSKILSLRQKTEGKKS